MNLAEITRMWLTRSREPFTFSGEYDRKLEYMRLENLGLYVHIPFCRKICSFCPYCKQVYDRDLCREYTAALVKEIHLVAGNNPRKKVSSLYFGGGSPALAIDELGCIITAVREHFEITDGIGIELHPSDVTVPLLRRLKALGITKISIGIQSFSRKYISILGRSIPDRQKIKAALSEVPFETVSMDFIFALPRQTAADLKRDIAAALDCGANHIACYPFIDFAFTGQEIPAMKNEEKRRLLSEITAYCRSIGLRRSSIWTFARRGAKYSSMTRDNYLGFGCSAVSLLRESFKINTFSVREYIERINSGSLPTSLTLHFSERQRMVYFLFWRAYGMEVDPKAFNKFFGKDLEKMYGVELLAARLAGFVRYRNGRYKMTDKGAFYYHYYENFYTLSYIDKMWGIMRETAFPESLEL